jgi:hypothetical protein
MSIAALYDRSRDLSLSEAERELARRQAEAAVHNECYSTAPGGHAREMRAAVAAVFCRCGEYREDCGHAPGYGDGDPALRRCERHGGRSQTECNVFEEVTA